MHSVSCVRSGRWLAPIVIGAGLACSRTGLQPATRDGTQATGATVDSGHGASPDASGVDRLVATMDASLCGNGKLDPGEECDDGNTLNRDGCSSQCKLECDFMCQCHPYDPPCVDVRVCGNGILTSDEECDDRNNADGDGCSNSCQVEPGWRCPAPGRRCLPICGDGLVVGWETCDDGNTVDGDGCASNCLVEPCWDCSRLPCVRGSCGDGGPEAGAAGRCGNGILEPGEECDDGDLNDDQGYGACTTGCKFGPYCGDGQINGPEECDLGRRNGLDLSKDGCRFGCTKPHYCGDGIVDTDLGEMCDMGDLNGVRVDDTGARSDTGRIFCNYHCHYIIY